MSAKERGRESTDSTSASRPTISDVARLARVSVGTVSNVISGRSTVTNERRRRVTAAMEELGYEVSMLARAMRRQRSSLIGLCVPNTAFASLSALADTLEERAVADGFE